MVVVSTAPIKGAGKVPTVLATADGAVPHDGKQRPELKAYPVEQDAQISALCVVQAEVPAVTAVPFVQVHVLLVHVVAVDERAPAAMCVPAAHAVQVVALAT